MACSSYGAPIPVANYPTFATNFYETNNQAQFNDSYSCPNNTQLNVNSLMPASWDNMAAVQSMSSDPKSDWARYAPTKEGVQRYISSSASARFGIMGRSPMGRTIGMPNLLRSQPPPALTLGEGSWFNNSSYRLALTNPCTQAYIGCGQ